MGPPPEGETPPPRRGEGVGDKAYLSYFFPCCVQFFNVVFCLYSFWIDYA